MEELSNNVARTRRRLAKLIFVTRWVWVTNALVGLAAFTIHHYSLATAAAYCSIMSVVLAGSAARAMRQLHSVEQVIVTIR